MDNQDVQKAIAAVKANPLPTGDTSSLQPWRVEGPRIFSADGSVVVVCWNHAEAMHLFAAHIAAPLLIAEVERLQAALAAARVAVEKARMFVECFIVPSDGLYDAISTFKVEIPADGYDRQWACDAAPAMLAEIDDVLARRALGLEVGK